MIKPKPRSQEEKKGFQLKIGKKNESKFRNLTKYRRIHQLSSQRNDGITRVE
jgi:hypothetical protein